MHDRRYATHNVGGRRLRQRQQTAYGHGVPSQNSPRGERFAQFIKEARTQAGIPQDTLADRAGVNRTTVIRWESGAAERPDPEQVRRVCEVLGVDARWAAVALGYLTAEEVHGTGGARQSAEIEEVLNILEDPTVPAGKKAEWVAYLKYIRNEAYRGRSAG